MDAILTNGLELLLMLFILITFLQSGIDKVVDWKGNVGWLKGHFEKSILAGTVPLLLGIILVLELICGLLAIGGIYQLVSDGVKTMAIYASLLSGLTLLMLLFGQRVAKDYAGALTIVCYFMVIIIGLFVLRN